MTLCCTRTSKTTIILVSVDIIGSKTIDAWNDKKIFASERHMIKIMTKRKLWMNLMCDNSVLVLFFIYKCRSYTKTYIPCMPLSLVFCSERQFLLKHWWQVERGGVLILPTKLNFIIQRLKDNKFNWYFLEHLCPLIIYGVSFSTKKCALYFKKFNFMFVS